MDESRENILNQDSWLPVSPDSVGGYLKIDLNKADLVSYSLNKRFRQGENGADLKMWFYDGNIPHQLDPANSSVTLYGKDSNGKYKVVSAQPDSDWQSGRVVMYLPSQCFASAGQYKRMVIEVKNSDQVIATINFSLDVLPNDFYNMNIGSVNFSSELNNQLINALNDANEQVATNANAADNATKKFQSDYDSLSQIAANIQKLVNDNDVVTKAVFDKHVTDMATKTYKASEINWQVPFTSWSEAGGSSLILRDGVVEMSLVAINTSPGGATMCTLPIDCRPKVEKAGVGMSMNINGHNAEPVFISILPDGRVIVQDTTHATAKIVFTTAYSLAMDESEKNSNDYAPIGGDQPSVPKPQIVKDQQSVTGYPVAGVYQPTNVYASDGTIGRALTVGQTYAVDMTGTMNGRKVLRVSTNEWVYVDEVAYSYVASGEIKAIGNSQTGYRESGQQYSLALKDGTPYVIDRRMQIGDKTAYRVATDQYLDSSDGTIVDPTASTGASTGAGGSQHSAPSQQSVTNEQPVTGDPVAGIYQSTNVFASDGTPGRALTVGQPYAVDMTGLLNGRRVLRISSNEWVYADEVAYSYVASGIIKTYKAGQTGYRESGQQTNLYLDEGTPYVIDRKMEIAGKIAYRVATDEYLDSSDGILQ